MLLFFYSNIPVRNADIVRIGFIQIKRSKRNPVFEDGIPFLVECIYNKAMMSLCVFADTKIFFSANCNNKLDTPW